MGAPSLRGCSGCAPWWSRSCPRLPCCSCQRGRGYISVGSRRPGPLGMGTGAEGLPVLAPGVSGAPVSSTFRSLRETAASPGPTRPEARASRGSLQGFPPLRHPDLGPRTRSGLSGSPESTTLRGSTAALTRQVTWSPPPLRHTEPWSPTSRDPWKVHMAQWELPGAEAPEQSQGLWPWEGRTAP